MHRYPETIFLIILNLTSYG